MKASNHSPFRSVGSRSIAASVLLLAAALSGTSQAATILANWTFETSQPTTAGGGAGPYAAEVNATAGAASASTNTPSGASVGVISTPAGNGSAHSFSSNGWNLNEYYQFQLPTTGATGISVSWDQTGSSTGPKDFGFFYSTDGTNFTQLGGTYVIPVSTWNATTVMPGFTFTQDLSAITAVENLSTLYFRLVNTDTVSIGNGTVASTGTDRVDNFIVNAATFSGAAVPEPSRALLLLGGLTGLAVRRRRSA